MHRTVYRVRSLVADALADCSYQVYVCFIGNYLLVVILINCCCFAAV